MTTTPAPQPPPPPAPVLTPVDPSTPDARLSLDELGRHWLHGGRTDLANLVLLCRRHHHAHHDGEFSIGASRNGADPRSFVFHRADGRVLEAHVDPARFVPCASPIRAGTTNDPNDGDGPRPAWTGTGQRLDRRYAISVLAGRRERHRAAA